jgi:hypothetical protein
MVEKDIIIYGLQSINDVSGQWIKKLTFIF